MLLKEDPSMSRYCKLLSLPTTALVALLLLAACQATGGPAAQPAPGASSAGSSSGQAAQSGDTPAKVRLAFLYDVHAAGLWTVPDCLRPRNVEVEMLSFKQFAEAQRAFETGQADFAGMGYQNLAQMEANNFSDYKIVAGVYSGSEHITLRKGVEVRSWKDFAGKKVGIPPNSFVEMLFRQGAAEGGLDMNDVQVVSFPGAGPPMLSALERGDIDAMVAWEPNNANAKVQGIGDYSPVVDLQQGATGKGTEVLYASGQIIRSNPSAVQRMVDCLVAQSDKVTKDHAAFEQALVSQTGLSPEVARTAIPTGEPDVRIYEAGAAKIIQLFAGAGLLQDFSAKVPERIDYTFLSKSTGKPAADLKAQ